MRIAILSDQHGSLPTIPECDLMILSGDITGGNPHGPRDNSDDRWVRWLHTDFERWTWGAPKVVATFGNHDTAVERFGAPDTPNVKWLWGSGWEWGGLKFWGGPWIRKWDTLAFNCVEHEMEANWGRCPKMTDVLVCHQPPLGAGDIPSGNNNHRVGCKWLAHTIQRVQPKLLTCGHIHEGRGVYDLYGSKVINSALAFTVIDI